MPHSNSTRLARAPRLLAGGALVLAAGALLPSCDLNQLLSDLFGIPLEPELTGQNAYVHLERSPSSAQTDVESMLAMLDWQEARAESRKAGEDVSLLTEDVVGQARATARLRNAIRPENFILFEIPDFAEGGPTEKAVFDPVDLNALRDEYTIPRLNAIPVRNQQNRGTCAAFTGVGAVEYAALQQYPSLSTLDLSEQRFYYLSKPECQSSGCTQSDAGSWYGTGFDTSLAASGPDIPLEADCPYNGNQTGNELQTPQAAACSTGAAQVLDLEVVVQPNEIIEQLHAGFPVPFASPLSDNYFQNSGIITLEDAGPARNSIHSGGHAYLLVGYRKLPSMPEEGGLCFIVKNSWGTGWGVNGFSCITLAWMQEYHFGYALEHPVVVSVELRDDLAGGDGGGGGDDDTPPDWADCETYDDETVDCDRIDDDEPVPDPTPPPDELVFIPVTFAGPAGEEYTGELASRDGQVVIRARVRGADTFSNTLTLEGRGNALFSEGDQVGEYSGNRVILCTGAYDPVCSLRFEPRTNSLYLEWLFPEYRAVREEELSGAGWQELVPIPGLGLGIEVNRPDNVAEALLSPLFVRMTDVTGEPTNPVRMTLRGLEIRAMGQTVGSINPTSPGLCSGDYRDRCSIFTGGQQLLFIPNW
jgi:C1A family cysteine protease